MILKSQSRYIEFREKIKEDWKFKQALLTDEWFAHVEVSLCCFCKTCVVGTWMAACGLNLTRLLFCAGSVLGAASLGPLKASIQEIDSI